MHAVVIGILLLITAVLGIGRGYALIVCDNLTVGEDAIGSKYFLHHARGLFG